MAKLAPLDPFGAGDPPGTAPPTPGASPLAGGRGVLAAEVETELEDDDYDPEASAPQYGCADEVEEDLESTTCDGPAGSSRSADSRSVDYAVPAANKEVWKNFGYNTEAGRALRRLYKSGSQSEASAMVAYPRAPSPSQRWEPKAAPRKPCPQRAPVRVPRARREGPDPDDPRNWRAPLPGRKPAKEILAEIEAHKPEVPNLPRGRDLDAEKEQLQIRFQFCGGRAMPKGAMGHVETAELPEAAPNTRVRHEERARRDENGMNAEHREIFEELMLAVKRKQERVAEIEAEEAAESLADQKPSKLRTARNKEALELRNDIERCLKDIDKLMELTEL